jgi:hypothetical protein
MRTLIASRIEGGAELISLSVPAGENPRVSFAGMFKDDPLFDDWQAAIAERRGGSE